MTTQTLTLTEFLLARIAEDEVVAERGLGLSVPSPYASLYNASMTGWWPGPRPD